MNIHKDINFKFHVLFFHEKFQLLSEVMDKILVNTYVTTPLWAKCEDETHTPKVGDLESSETPECLEFDIRCKNTSHWDVVSVIGEVLKCRYPKMPCIGHLDIFSPSYGQKKGWESTSSRHPILKCDMALEISQKELQFWFRPCLDWTLQSGDMSPQSSETPIRDSFGTPTWESRKKKPFGCSLHGVTQRILYGGRWWLKKIYNFDSDLVLIGLYSREI